MKARTAGASRTASDEEVHRLRIVLGAGVALALATALGAVWLGRLADARTASLRTHRVELQRLERTLRRLDAPEAPATLERLREGRDALRVRLVETLGAAGVERLRHRLEERALADEELVTLRLAVEGRVAHGAALIDLLGAVHEAARPWPSETRGCSVQRVPDALSIGCAVDILHWRAPAAPAAPAGPGG